MIIHNINAIYKTEYKVLNVSNLNLNKLFFKKIHKTLSLSLSIYIYILVELVNMFGLYRRCCSIKDNISVNCMDNGSSINTFTNSSNISTIPNSILYNRTHRSANGKIMNVLLLLFLLFGSCVVSFGMDGENIHINDNNELNNQENQYKCEKADESLNKYRCNFFLHYYCDQKISRTTLITKSM